MVTASPMHLVLFLSRATPLNRWQKSGILSREAAIYQRLQQEFCQVSIVTCGGEEELAYDEHLGNIQILPNRWKISPNLYSLLAPILHRDTLRQATIYKTNQLDGAWTAVLAAKLYRKPVIVRAGYLWANNFARQQGASKKARLIRFLERFSFRQATHVVVTTHRMKQYVCETYHLPTEQVTVIPNYVDTDCFRPDTSVEKVNGRIGFVGRLTAVKNLDILVNALAGLPGISLVVVGTGEQEVALKQLAAEHEVDVQFLGRIDNSQLPLELNRSQIFVLPSKFEGHPKALIEAMACGTAVIGTDVEGINDVIHHNENGMLCRPTPESLRQAIVHVLADEQKRKELGANARQYVLQNFAVTQIVERELMLMRHILGR